MHPDPGYLREYYSSLNDEALLNLDRSQLVEAAQKCYDEEVRRRGQDVPRKVVRDAHVVPKQVPVPDRDAEVERVTVNVDGKPGRRRRRPKFARTIFSLAWFRCPMPSWLAIR